VGEEKKSDDYFFGAPSKTLEALATALVDDPDYEDE
jgi:hypothetical protein